MMPLAAGREPLAAGDPLHRLRAPIGAHVREDAGPVREQVLKEHGHGVEGIVFRAQHKGFPAAVPIELAVEHGLQEIEVGLVVRPLALALDAPYDGVVAAALLDEAHFRQAGIADHKVPHDEHVLDHKFPLGILLLPAELHIRWVLIKALLAVGPGPGQGLFKLLVVVDALIHPAEDLGLIHGLAAHSEVFLEQVLVQDAARDAHAHGTDLQIAVAPHTLGGNARLGKEQDLFPHVRGDLLVLGVLHVVAVDAEGRPALLGIGPPAPPPGTPPPAAPCR